MNTWLIEFVRDVIFFLLGQTSNDYWDFKKPKGFKHPTPTEI